jgi:hypothetical protein
MTLAPIDGVANKNIECWIGTLGHGNKSLRLGADIRLSLHRFDTVHEVIKG